MKTVTLWIDGRKIFADEDATILEAARENGIAIPTLCHHPRLAPLGHCRLCIVQVEGLPRPVTACDNPVREGMAVTTDTPLLAELRAEILRLALATHPYEDCLTCEKGGACELQDRAYCFQVRLPAQLPRELPAVSDDNRYILRDPEKCILCGRCIQVCRSHAGRYVFSLAGKGVNTRVVAGRQGEEKGLAEAGCIFCGQCVDACPVGALTEKERAARGREWALQRRPGVCLECSLGCRLERHFRGYGPPVKITVPREGAEGVWICVRGKFGAFEKSADYLTAPLIREGGGFREAGYDEALQKTAAMLLFLKEKYGPGSLAVLGDGRLSNEESFLWQKLARSVLHTPRVNLGVEAAWLRAARALEAVTGKGVRGPDMAALQRSDAVLVLGGGLAETHPVAAMVLQGAARLGNTAVLQVGSAGVEGAWSGLKLNPRPGLEAALLRGIAAALKGESPDSAAAAAGVERLALQQAAQILAAGNSCTVVAPGFLKSGGEDLVEALLEAAQAAGQLGYGRCRVLLLPDTANARGLLETGGVPAEGEEEAFAETAEGAVKGLLAVGELTAIPARGLAFLAAVCRTKRAIPPQADVVFPAPPDYAVAGTFTNAAGEEAENRTAAVTPGKSLLALACDLAGAMGASWSYSSLEAVREELRRAKA